MSGKAEQERGVERDMKEKPYDAQEQRVCDYLIKATEGNIGCGDDPVRFLIASHAMLTMERKLLGTALRRARGVIADRRVYIADASLIEEIDAALGLLGG